MNLIAQKGINDLQAQSQKFIESEMQDQSTIKNGKNEQNQQNEPKGSNEPNAPKENIEINNGSKPKKKKKKLIVDRTLAIRMYTIVFIHTLIITILLFFLHFKSDNIINEKIKELDSYSWYIFGCSILLSIILSLFIYAIKLSFFNYLLYAILLVLNAITFVLGEKLSSFDYPISMLIMFDSASVVILIFLALIKDAPSTFWLMCSCVAGNLISMYILSRVFSENKYLIFLTCLISFGIYETMNYNALDCKKSIPSMMSLPFNLNVSFVKLIYYILYGIFYLLKSCCCSGKK